MERDVVTPHYFVFKGKNSQDMGVQVVSYPPIVRAKEKLKQITVPGRSGFLTMCEGDQVYESYTRRMTIACRLDDAQVVQAWLSGSGTFVAGNEPDFGYEVLFNEPLSMQRLMNGWIQGDLTMICQPFKHKYPSPVIYVTSGIAKTITRQGDLLETRPRIIISSWSDGATVEGPEWTITVNNDGATGGNAMVDASAELTGGAGKITLTAWPTLGASATIKATKCRANIYPNWGWL